MWQFVLCCNEYTFKRDNKPFLIMSDVFNLNPLSLLNAQYKVLRSDDDTLGYLRLK